MEVGEASETAVLSGIRGDTGAPGNVRDGDGDPAAPPTGEAGPIPLLLLDETESRFESVG